MKVLVIASESTSADRLRAADEAIRRAELVQRETVERLYADALQQRFGLPGQRAE